MIKPDTSGSAFPISLPGWGDNGAFGLTKREYIAIKAMQAQIEHYGCSDGFEILAKQSYEIADEMLRSNHGG